jgi:hypothetical protein
VDHLVLLLPLVDAIEDRLAQLRQGGGVSPALAGLLERMRGWMAQPPAALSATRAAMEADLQGWHAGLMRKAGRG